MAKTDRDIVGLGRACARRHGENREAWRSRKKNMTEKHFRSHRDTPSGRNFVFWNSGPNINEEQDNYRNNFDSIFPNSPGAGV